MATCDLRNFLSPCLLLLLHERPDHGYDLITRLRPFLDAEGDPAGVYRVLRHLERDGLVASKWTTSVGGPARRRYSITTDGQQALRQWSLELRSLRDNVDRFLFRYRALSEPLTRPRPRRRQPAVSETG